MKESIIMEVKDEIRLMNDENMLTTTKCFKEIADLKGMLKTSQMRIRKGLLWLNKLSLRLVIYLSLFT